MCRSNKKIEKTKKNKIILFFLFYHLKVFVLKARLSCMLLAVLQFANCLKNLSLGCTNGVECNP